MAFVFAIVARAGVAQAQWLNYLTPGTPRLPDGKPNLSGLWSAECLALTGCWSESRFFDLTRGVAQADTQMTPWAAAIQEQREKREHVDDPVGYGLPQGYPRMTLPNAFRILVTRRARTATRFV